MRLALSVPEAARILGIGTRTMWTRIWAGDIRTVRLGRRVLVPVEVLAELLGTTPEAVAQAATGGDTR